MSALLTGQCPPSSASHSRAADEPIYSRAFWMAYVANLVIVAANALTFRFAELVVALGGKEQTAGLIVGAATAVALGGRLFLGQAIDRYGVRRLWILSAWLFVAGGACLTFSETLEWPMYVARSLFAVGLAGGLTSSAVHIQNLVPVHRRTEVLGSLGSSGFLGLIVGTLLSDLLFQLFSGPTRFHALFGLSTALGLTYLALIIRLTRTDRHVTNHQTPGLHRLVVQFWPGNVMLAAFAMGLVQSVTTVFLTRFATQRELSGLGPFFVTYALSAFTFRIISRNWSRSLGRHRMILGGLLGHIVGLLGLPFVSTEWQFALPAIAGGFGHALLFPAVVSLGSEAFPLQYRGTGTTLVIGFFDVGMFASAPVLGTIIDRYQGAGYVPMFLFSALFLFLVMIVYRFTSARRFDSDLAVPLTRSADSSNSSCAFEQERANGELASEAITHASSVLMPSAAVESAAALDVVGESEPLNRTDRRSKTAVPVAAGRLTDAEKRLSANSADVRPLRRPAIGPTTRCR